MKKATADAARKKADAAGFSDKWERPGSGPSILTAQTRATALDSHEAAVDWFKIRLRELADSHVLDLLLGTGQDLDAVPTIAERTKLSPADEAGAAAEPPNDVRA